MKIRFMLIAVTVLLAGCGGAEKSNVKKKVEQKPSVVEYMAGKPAVDSYQQAKATIEDINEKQKKRIEQSLQQ